MKTKLLIVGWMVLLALSTLNLQLSTAFAQGTAFTYQGRLNDGANPANGNYDLRFSLWTAASGGSSVVGYVTNSPVAASNGLFTTTIDFGSDVFTGNPLWLQIGVRTNGATGGFTGLSPRQQLTPAPYAIMAANASNLLGTLPAAQVTGPIPASQLSGTPTAATNFTGALAGDVTGTQSATMVASVGGQTAANVAGGASAANAATNANAANTIVKRDASGSFTSTSITLSGSLYLPFSTSSKAAIYAGANTPLMIGDGTDNFFAGPLAGNLSVSIWSGDTGLGSRALEFLTSGNDNTGVGSSALASDTSGSENTAVGYAALLNNTNGTGNTAVGANTLYGNVGGSANVAVGDYALNKMSMNSGNVGVGNYALFSSTNGNNNTAVGWTALYGSTNGSYNVALGYMAGRYLAGGSSNIDIGNYGVATDTNIIRIGDQQTQTFIAGTINGNGGGLTNLNASQLAGGAIPLAQLPVAVLTNGETGTVTFNGDLVIPSTGVIYAGGYSLLYGSGTSGNSFVGPNAGNFTMSGGGNTAGGYLTLSANTSGAYNTANGYQAIHFNTSGSFNTANGTYALYANTSGDENTANGYEALSYNTNGYYNTADGALALRLNTSGAVNTANGVQALYSNTSGSGNTASGVNALYYNTSGSNNVADGTAALMGNATGSYNTAVGNMTMGNNNSGSTNIALGYYAGHAIIGSYNIDIGNPGDASDNAIIRIGTAGIHTAIYLAGAAYLPGAVYASSTVSATNTIYVDAGAQNTGSINPGLIFGGASSTEGISSSRSGSLTNGEYGLDFYTANGVRMRIQNDGNVGIGVSNPTNKLMVVNARCDGSSWINSSDRNLKQDFASINPQAVLARVAAMPVQTWSYKTQPGQKHLGPVAQDFYAAFRLGADDVSIATVDEGGVALAAIQGLNQKLEQKETEITELKARLDKLEQLLNPTAR